MNQDHPSMKNVRLLSRVLVLAALVAAADSSSLAADLRLPRIFTDHMVLQRDKPVRVWGWAEKGETVTVEFAGQSKTTKAADDGTWQVILDPMAVSTEGRTLIVKSSIVNRQSSFQDVLVGDVWLGSGKSNMELELGGMDRGDIAAFLANYPLIRLMNVPKETSATPDDDMPGAAWKICTPATAAGFSAVAYYFARDVHLAIGVPIGMVVSARGGTYPESWQTRTSLESLKSPVVDKLLAYSDKRVTDWVANPKGADPRHGEPGLMLPAGCYNHMIHPIEKFAIRGALFYQGENSAVNNGGAINFAHGYPLTYPAVVRNWRRLFDDPNLPFCIIEMAPWGTPVPLTSRDIVDHPSPFVRDIHRLTYLNWPHTGLVVTMDCGKVGDMHPTKKEPVGHRAALWALSQVYHATSNTWTGPLYRSMETKGNKAVIRFHRDGLTLPLGMQNPAGNLDGFIIAGTNRVWQAAQAVIAGETVEVWSDKVPEPAAVRYAWEDAQGQVNLLVNADGLPASPFRTDNWVSKPIFDQPLLLPAEGARPWADAGPDQMMLTKSKTITLDGSGSYSPDGTIVKYAWTKLSGPSVKMSGETTKSLTLNGPVQGNYSFRLTVTDNHGNTASDDVAVQVTDRSLPVAVAGKDQTLPYPVTSTVLDGSASQDKLGSITSYVWKHVSGPGKVTLADDKTAKATASGLKVGTHVFRLTVTDNLGAKSSADVSVTVMPPPVAVIYEPFAGPSGADLNGQGGVGDTGFSDKWMAGKGPVITADGLSYGNLAVAGNALKADFGAKAAGRTINASALARRGLLADGAELWFSFLLSGITVNNVETWITLGDARWNGTSYPGNAIGVCVARGNIPKAAMIIGGTRAASSYGHPICEGDFSKLPTTLVVGRIKWGTASSAPATLQLYLVDKDLALPTANPLLAVSGVLDQSKFNALCIGSPAVARYHAIDEIRFGASYYDVTPGAGSQARDTSAQKNETVAAPVAHPPTKPAGVVIYEPFNYPVGENLDGQGGTSDVGFSSKWVAHSANPVIGTNLTHGTLPTAGGSVRFRSGVYRDGWAARTISNAGLKASGLLDDGATLWFSALIGCAPNANVGELCFSLALATEAFPTDRGMEGYGVGVCLVGGRVKPSVWYPGGAAQNGSTIPYAAGRKDLVVGNITWGTNGTNHTLTIYQPDEKLNLGEPAGRPPSLSFKMNQADLNTLTFGYSDFGILDEIRFGATYADVIGTAAAEKLSGTGQTTEAVSGKTSRSAVREIAAVRYAPPDTYMKDHCLIRKDGQWHLFAPLGKVGTMWQHAGSEESAEHMVSEDLVNWKHLGTAVPASQREGHFDRLMGGIAPHVIEQGGNYFMYYAGWDFRSKQPLDMQGFRQGIGMALSKDLVHWEKPAEFAKDGLAPKGSGQCVVRDESQQRWLMYVGRSAAVFVYQSKDLWHWAEAGFALDRSDLSDGKTDMNPGESPFVMKHPRSGKWIIFVNGGYSVSDNPLKFPRIQPYPFKAGIFLFLGAHDEGKGTFYHADDDGAGFAHEIIEFNGQWYMTGAVGTDGHTRLKFTRIEWTEDALTLAPVIAPLPPSGK